MVESLHLSWEVPLRDCGEVVVVGGGPAGIAAAVAAARTGAKVILGWANRSANKLNQEEVYGGHKATE